MTHGRIADNESVSVLVSEPSLAHRTARGFLLLFLQTTILRVTSFGGQIVIAWFLIPADYGMASIAVAVSSGILILQQSGLREVLVAKGRRLHRWTNAAFWLSMASGVVAAAVTIALAPAAERIFGYPGLAGLLFVCAAIPLFNALGVVPSAVLQANMRFGRLALIGTWVGFGATLLAILLAYLGWGAYSLVIPSVAGAIVQALVLWIIAPTTLRLKLQFMRWPTLGREASYLQGVAATGVVMAQGDNTILALFQSPAVVGIYAFAFNFAIRPQQMFAANLTSALFPALAQLQHDRVRQTQAFLRAARPLALIGIPICIAQAAVADPIIRLLFNRAWLNTIPVAAILSIGMAFLLLGAPACALLQARRQFGYYFVWTLACSAAFLAAVFAGAHFGGAISVAIAVAAFSAIFGPLGTYVAVRPGGGTFHDVIVIYLVPLVCSVLCFGFATVISSDMSHSPAGNIAHILVVLGLGSAPYVILSRLFMAREWNEVATRCRGLIGGRFSRRNR